MCFIFPWMRVSKNHNCIYCHVAFIALSFFFYHACLPMNLSLQQHLLCRSNQCQCQCAFIVLCLLRFLCFIFLLFGVSLLSCAPIPFCSHDDKNKCTFIFILVVNDTGARGRQLRIPSSTNKFFFYTMMLLISSFFGCDGALFLFFRRFQLIGYMYLLCCLDWVPLFLVVWVF